MGWHQGSAMWRWHCNFIAGWCQQEGHSGATMMQIKKRNDGIGGIGTTLLMRAEARHRV
jgi:hypothetical protein